MSAVRSLSVLVAVLVAAVMAGPPAALAEAETRRDCTLPGSTEGDEFARCYTVAASLSRAPAVGQIAVLRVDVTAEHRRDGAQVTVDLPEQLEFVEAPGALARASARAADGRSVNRASGKADFAAGQQRSYTFRVRGVSKGAGEIQARVTTRLSERYTDSASDLVFVTVGADAGSSKLTIDVPRIGQAKAASVAAGGAEPERGHEAPPPPEDQEFTNDDGPSEGGRRSAAPSPGRSCGTTGFFYQFNGTKAVGNLVVQAWDNDTSSADDLIASGFTLQNGTIELCWDNDDGEGGATQEVYLKFVTSNNRWRIQRSQADPSPYIVSVGDSATVPDNTTKSFGSWQAADSNWHRAFHAYDALNEFWLWQYDPVTRCWDRNDAAADCRRITVNWTPTSTDGPVYRYGPKQVFLPADAPDSEHTVIHEGAHSVMGDMYEDNWPPTACGSPHYIESSYDEGCAWTEGWAEWVPAMVKNDPYYRWADGGSLNLETPTWGTSGWANGDTVEGRVAGALIDVSDPANEPWDQYGEGQGPGPIWTVTTNNRSTGLAQFWSQRAAAGHNVAANGALASLYQSTVDYSFRDPLSSYVQKTRPAPLSTKPHNYRHVTTASYWSAVAVRAPSASDYNLQLYADFAQTSLLEQTSSGAGLVDVIAVNSNSGFAPLGDYYPRVTRVSGSGDYTIELAHGASTLPYASSQSFALGDVVSVRDVSLTANVPVRIVVDPNRGQDVGVLLFRSTPGSTTTWYSDRGEAVAAVDSGGGGATETLVYTPTASGRYGLVILNKAGFSSVLAPTRVYWDTSAPAGTIRINGDAVATNTVNVVVNNNVSDAQSGMSMMRHSVDGTLDTEPWVAFASTAALTLPTGDGTKTVRAQFRNNAGFVSSTLSDTITLDTSPGACTINGTDGPDRLVGTDGDDIICGYAGNDTILAGAGNDIVRAGDGDDTVEGEAGTDTLYGGAGNDTLDGAALGCCEGAGTSVDDVLYGEAGNDTLHASDLGAATLDGGADDDTLFGYAGHDLLRGGDGVDTMNGGAGNDTFDEGAASNGGDTFTGGAGNDLVTYAARQVAVVVAIDLAAGDGEAGENDLVRIDVEKVTGGRGGDTLTGGDLNNVLVGGLGDDQLDGGPGHDTLIGGGDDDHLLGSAGNDKLNGGPGADTLDGGDNNDTLIQGGKPDGADIMIGGAGRDAASYAARTDAVSVTIGNGDDDGAPGEGDDVRDDVENLIGGRGGDTLTGNAVGNVIRGNGGDDTLVGRPGPDRLHGGGGDDSIDAVDGINGNDTVDGGADTDTATADPSDTVVNVP